MKFATSSGSFIVFHGHQISLLDRLFLSGKLRLLALSVTGAAADFIDLLKQLPTTDYESPCLPPPLSSEYTYAVADLLRAVADAQVRKCLDAGSCHGPV